MNSSSVNIQMTATDDTFTVVLFTLLYKVNFLHTSQFLVECVVSVHVECCERVSQPSFANNCGTLKNPHIIRKE